MHGCVPSPCLSLSLQVKQWSLCLQPPDDDLSIMARRGNNPHSRALTHSQDIWLMDTGRLPWHVCPHIQVLWWKQLNAVLKWNITNLSSLVLTLKKVLCCLQALMCARALLFVIVKLSAHHFPLCDTLQMIQIYMLLFALPCRKQLHFLHWFPDLVCTSGLERCGQLNNTDSAWWKS